MDTRSSAISGLLICSHHPPEVEGQEARTGFSRVHLEGSGVSRTRNWKLEICLTLSVWVPVPETEPSVPSSVNASTPGPECNANEPEMPLKL